MLSLSLACSNFEFKNYIQYIQLRIHNYITNFWTIRKTAFLFLNFLLAMVQSRRKWSHCVAMVLLSHASALKDNQGVLALSCTSMNVHSPSCNTMVLRRHAHAWIANQTGLVLSCRRMNCQPQKSCAVMHTHELPTKRVLCCHADAWIANHRSLVPSCTRINGQLHYHI